MIFKHAIATIRTPRHDRATTSRRTTRRPDGRVHVACRLPRHRHRARQRRHRRAARRRRVRRRGQQHARQHRARASACACRRCARLGPRPPRRPRRARRRSRAAAAFGRMAEASPGKDSVTGHWEMMGIVLDRPFPVFPARVSRRRSSRRSSARIGRRDARQRGGLGHRRSSTSSAPSTCAPGAPIVYTSADSVFQIAAHEDVIPVAELYRMCEVAYELVGDGPRRRPRDRAAVRRRRRARSTRTANRHDYALPPSGDDAARPADGARAAGRRDRQDRGPVRRPRHHRAPCHTTSDDAGHGRASSARWTHVDAGLIFANLVDFDTLYGHRNDVAGLRGATSSASTRGWPSCCRGSRPTTCWSSPPITATTRRRRAPTTRASTCRCSSTGARRARPGVDLGTRATFADLGQTLAELFGVARAARTARASCADRR